MSIKSGFTTALDLNAGAKESLDYNLVLVSDFCKTLNQMVKLTQC